MPPLNLSYATAIHISEKCGEAASGWKVLYRGLLATQTHPADLEALEMVTPEWLLAFLFANRAVSGGSGNQKFSFYVVPWKGQDGLPEVLSQYVSQLLVPGTH